jgi:HSP20 family molecular chaperone IbpA
MSFFDDEPFDEIFNSFFSRGNSKKAFSSTTSENLDSFVQCKKKIYLVLDLSGKIIKDVKIKDKIIQNDYGERVANGQKVLEIKSENEKIAYVVPKNVNTKGFNWNFKNGMLEVEFKK